MMMLVRHHGGYENDGAARRALLIFVPLALPHYLIYWCLLPPHSSLNLLPIRGCVFKGTPGFLYKLSTPLQPHFIKEPGPIVDAQ